ncbi:hypothetical protein Tco_1473345 [Tanacetum coccineum]
MISSLSLKILGTLETSSTSLIIKTKAKVAKSNKKKQPAKRPKAKGLDVLSKVALTEAEQIKLATKRSKTQFYSSHASGLGDGDDTQSKVPNEQHLKTTGTNDGTSTIPRVPNVPIYESKSEKESWGNSEEEDEDYENDSDHKSNGNNYDDANDDDNQEGDDTNDDDKETDSDRTESDIIKIPVLNQSITEYYEEKEEKIDDEETMDEEEDNEVTKEMYDDVNMNLGNEDTDMTNANQRASERQNVSLKLGFKQVEEDAHVTLTPVLDTQKADKHVQSSSVSSDFISKLLNLENPSPADNEIASLMETSACHAMVVPEITFGFITTIPPPPPFFNPLPQQATPTPTPTTSEATTLLTSLLDFSSVFKLNKRVTKLGEAINKAIQALSSIHVIVDHYTNNKLREAINKAIQAHNLDCRQKAQDDKNAYIELVDTSIRAIIKEEVAKSNKKKQSVKIPKAKGLDVLSKVPDEQHLKTTGTDKGTGTIPGVPDVHIYESKSEKESWGDTREEDEDDENNFDHKSDGNNDDGDNQEGDDTNDDDKETDKEEKIDDEETMDGEEDNEVTKELYDDVNVNLGNEDTDMTNAYQGASERQNVSLELGFEEVEEDAHVTLTLVLDTPKADEPVQSSSVSSNFTSKLLNLKNPSLADNKIASLMETSARHAVVVLEITSGFITTIPPPPPFFNPLPQQATPTPTPTTSEATILLTSLLDFSLYSIDRYINNKLREAINKAIQAHNLDCRQKAQDDKNAYIELVNTSMRAIIKEEVNT